MVSKVPKAVKDPLHADNRNAPTPPRVAVEAPGRAARPASPNFSDRKNPNLAGRLSVAKPPDSSPH